MSAPSSDSLLENSGVVAVPHPTNTLGSVGFLVSLAGLLTCGLLSPLGLLLSFIGLFKAPRGLAVGGTVLGLAGSGGLMVLLLVGSYVSYRYDLEQHKLNLEMQTTVQPQQVDLPLCDIPQLHVDQNLYENLTQDEAIGREIDVTISSVVDEVGVASLVDESTIEGVGLSDLPGVELPGVELQGAAGLSGASAVNGQEGVSYGSLRKGP